MTVAAHPFDPATCVASAPGAPLPGGCRTDGAASDGALLRDLRALLSVQVLSDARVTLDMLELRGLAQRFFFFATATVAPLSTAVVVNISAPLTSVMFWRGFSQSPDASNVFTVVPSVDGQQLYQDRSAIARTVIPESLWLPMRRFTISVVNNDAIAPHTIEFFGLRVLLDVAHWGVVRARIDGVLAAVLGDAAWSEVG